MGLSKKNHYVPCLDCGCRLEMNGVCKICGHEDVPPLPGMVPDVVGLTEVEATKLIEGPECQLVLGDVYEDNDETVPFDTIISSDPIAETHLEKKAKVDITISLGPAG